MHKRLKQSIFANVKSAADTAPPSTPIEKLEALQAQIPQAGYIRQAGLLQVLPISPATLWRWTKANQFPKPVKLSPNVTAWRLIEVRNWLERRG